MDNPLRIFFLLQNVPALYGAERVTLSLLSGLKARGVDVRVLLIGESRLGSGPGDMGHALAATGLPVDRFDVSGRFSWKLVRWVRQHLRERPGSILHTLGYKAHLHGLFAARGIAPTATTLHGWLVRPELKERFYEWLEIHLLRRDDAVICLSSYYERRLLDLGVRRERLHRIPTGLSPEQIPTDEQASVWPPGPFTIALVGRLSWEKNHDLFLRAVARLRGEGLDIRAILAGTGPEKSAIEARICELGLAASVRSVGYVPIADLLPAVHAVCLCSHIENLPLSLLEAMAWQRPVVATRVGGIPDIVEDGVTGFLVEDDDENFLAEAVKLLMADSSTSRRMGQIGSKAVKTFFLLLSSVDQHLALYTRMLKAVDKS